MAVDAARAGLPTRGVRLRLSAIFWRRPWLKAAALLAPPVLGFVGVYLSSLVVLFVSAFWSIDSFSGKLLHVWTLDNFKQLFSTSDSTYWRITGRTVHWMGNRSEAFLTDNHARDTVTSHDAGCRRHTKSTHKTRAENCEPAARG